MIDFPIHYKRDKGPSTPNFRKMSIMLNQIIPKIQFDKKAVIRQHGAVGIKMCFVCDVMENLKTISPKVTSWHDGKEIIYTKKKEFYDFLFHLDIYVFELYSILDYFALELGYILKLQKKWKGKLVDIEYFKDLKRAKGFNQKTIAIKQEVKILENQPWFKYLHDMRNRIVHRLPISFGALIPLPLHNKNIEFPFLPDKPKNYNSTYTQKLVPLIKCKKWLEGTFNFVDDVCAEIGRELFDNF